MEKSRSVIFDSQDTRWGGFHSIAEYTRGEHKAKVKVLFLANGNNISYQKHEHRTEVWNILSGKGTMIVNGQKMEVKQGETIFIPVGTWHTAKAEEGSYLEVIEIQFGAKTEEDDIIRSNYEWSDILKEVGLDG